MKGQRQELNIDQEFVERLASREWKAYSEFGDVYFDIIKDHIIRRHPEIKNHAKDIAQEIIMKIPDALQGFEYRGHREFTKWVLIAARRKAIDWIRKLAHQGLLTTEDLESTSKESNYPGNQDKIKVVGGETGGLVENPEEEWNANIDYNRALRRAFDRMESEEERHLMQMKLDMGMTLEEMATALGKPLGIIRNQYYEKALPHFRKAYAKV